MKKYIVVVICITAYLFACMPALAQKIPVRKLIWQDEFNYTGLPDVHKWKFETGFHRNREQQYYTNRKENVIVQKGSLIITGRKQTLRNASYKKGSEKWQHKDSLAYYTSGSIKTQGIAGFLYGRIEIRAKLPQGSGMWPAFWMMGVNRNEVGWPDCGEIDIMEFAGAHPFEIHGTLHYPDRNTEYKSDGSKITDSTIHSAFHVFAIEWSKSSIDFYFDKKLYHSFNIESTRLGKKNPFNKAFFLKLNLAMGARWPGPIDDTVLPQQLLIDYVRVYK